MPRYRLSDMDFDEVSTVDKPANQYSRIVLAKRLQEDGMPPEYDYEEPEAIFDPANGEPVDPASLDPEDLVADAEGYLWHHDGERLVPVWQDEIEYEDEREPEPVGKSAFLENAGRGPDPAQKVLEGLRDELSKALDDEARNEVVSKAVQGLVDENARLAKRVTDFEMIAKREREIRLEREYIAKADSYNVPVHPEELGPVLMRMADTMSYEDCAVIDKALTASGAIFTELGLGGESDVADPFTQIEEYAAGELAKRDGRTGISKEQATVEFFDEHPEAYREYRQQQEQARS